MFAIKEMVIEQNPAYENEVESRLQAWEEQWGNINKLNNEAQSHGIAKELLEASLAENQEIEKTKKDLCFTNLVDVAVYKEDLEEREGISITDKEFCERYTYNHGKKINPDSLKAARNGTGQYIKRNAKGVIRERQENKER